MAACTDGDEICEHELAADFIPNSASRWKRCHAEKLNIYCVPIHKSQYYMNPLDGVVDQQVQKSAAGFSATDRKFRSKCRRRPSATARSTSTSASNRSTSTSELQKSLHSRSQQQAESALPVALTAETDSLRLTPLPTAAELHIKENKRFIRVQYEYDYKSLLRDMIKPHLDPDKCDKWWAKFELEVVRRYNIMEIVDRNLTQPDIDEEMSLAFSESFMARTPSSGNGAECQDPSKKILEDLLKDVQEEEDRVKFLRQNTLADQSMDTAWRTPVSRAFDFLDFRLTMFCLHFLEALDSLIENHVNGLPSDEHCFENLFQTFARIFFLELRIASKRSMNLFGENVSSIPNLRCEVLHGHRLQGGLVITVAEVKPHVKESQPISSYNLPSGGPSEESFENPDDFDLPDEVFGQHAAELLVELPYTALTRFGNKECIFGMIIQCTKVRLTCLHMSDEHLQMLQESEPIELNADDKAKIHYSRPYDILNREDRKHLAYILLLFAYLTDNDVFLK
ncbi:uncharacterized protein LOC135485710 isoform X2 [Lineus longissimus]|uniref:uncharacterized protein LOC135485710 isoform X2 n=1 Tax=Lineus longissimus TaxID=88925 RepID=UPI00315DC6A5